MATRYKILSFKMTKNDVVSVKILFSGLNVSAIEQKKKFGDAFFYYLGSGNYRNLPVDNVAEFKKLVLEKKIWKYSRSSVASNLGFVDYAMAEKILERHYFSRLLGEEKRSLIIGAISYWVCFLEENCFSCIVHGTASPHAFWNYTLCVAAKLFGIPQWTIVADFILNKINLMQYPGNNVYHLSSDLADISEIDKFLKTQTLKIQHPSYIGTHLKRGDSFLKTLISTIPKNYLKAIFTDIKRSFGFEFYDVSKSKTAYLFLRFFNDVSLVNKLRILQKEYIKLQADIDKKDFEDNAVVYFASFQPEATTTPDAGRFNNPKQVIAELQKHGLKVYYKEHPVTFSYEIQRSANKSAIYKRKGFYRELYDSGVTLIPANFDNNEIIKSDCKLATCSGTIALQAISNNRNILVLGRAWYGKPPGVLNNIDEFFKYKASINREEIMSYMYSRWGKGLSNIVGVMNAKPKVNKADELEFFSRISKLALETQKNADLTQQQLTPR